MGSTNMDSTEYVVAYRIEFERPRKSTSDELLVTGTYEFFRGPKEECYRIASAFGDAGRDTREHNVLRALLDGRMLGMSSWVI